MGFDYIQIVFISSYILRLSYKYIVYTISEPHYHCLLVLYSLHTAYAIISSPVAQFNPNIARIYCDKRPNIENGSRKQTHVHVHNVGVRQNDNGLLKSTPDGFVFMLLLRVCI